MVSVLTKEQLNRTFQLRMGLLGKSAFPSSGDADEPPQITLPNLPPKPGPIGGKKLRTYTLDEQEYAALYSEGTALYQRNEFARAIEAFSKANDLTVEKPNPNILIDRADCYIQIGMPELALQDVNRVLSESKNNPRAILTKAEAYFSMGEFEFALVFYQRGLLIRKDMSGFKDGVAKAKHAILDAIHGESVFQPNPNYATSRPRKALYQSRALPPKEGEEVEEVEQKPVKDTSKLLPEKVAPLASTEENEKYLGELSLDYEFLEEIKSELDDPNNCDKEGEKEDNEIKKIVDGALDYLKQRGAFWSQQGKQSHPANNQKTSTRSSRNGTTRTSKSPKARRDAAAAKSQQPHYEMSKLQQYENKYPDVSSESK